MLHLPFNMNVSTANIRPLPEVQAATGYPKEAVLEQEYAKLLEDANYLKTLVVE